MSRSHELQPGMEKKGGFLNAWKRFNQVSAAVLAAAGIVFEQPILLGLAAIDILQSYVIGKIEKARERRQVTKQLGSKALLGTRKPAFV
ncbi:hypothetical protein HYW35_03330 [Candidatus Saccharibacteria bacterium]|nr:hypothetical protein [Candidatus Saccharibacteria bacterium]